MEEINRFLDYFPVDLYVSMFKQSPQSVIITDSNHSILYVNPAFTKTTGYGLDEVHGKNPSILHGKDTEPEYVTGIGEELEKKGHIDRVVRNYKKDGVPFWNRIRVHVVDHDDTKYYIGYSQDVTDGYIEKLIQGLNVKILEQTSVVVFQWFPKEGWPVATVTNNVEKIFGYTAQEFLNGSIKFIDTIHSSDINQVSEEVQSYTDTKKDQFYQSYRIVTKSGAIRYIRDTTIIDRTEEGEVEFYKGVIEDITEQVEASHSLKELNENLEQRVVMEVYKNEQQQMKLFNQSRSSQIGSMMETITHQWKQPLSIMSGLIQQYQRMIERNMLEPTEMIDFFVEIQGYIGYLDKTISDFRSFFRPEKEKVTFSVSSVMQEALSLSFLEKDLLDQRVHVKLSAEEPIHLEGNINMFHHIILVLVNNSIDAFRSQSTPSEDRLIEIYLHYDQTDQQIEICFQDTAGGIPEDIVDKVFNHYFSTKLENGSGVGLGFVSDYIAEELKGSVSVENCEYENGLTGASFYIKIPLSQEMIHTLSQQKLETYDYSLGYEMKGDKL
ncbi:MAG: PAS domain S-box protein [Patescibacteria group bacterium]|nr:PAS domain S-box protein [Patescibacteria group bacterium]